MAWLSILTNKWIAGSLAALALAAGLWLGGDAHGRRVQKAKDTAAISTARTTMDAALSANWTNWQTIGQLRLANQRWAKQAEISGAKAKEADDAVSQQAADYSSELAKIQAKLKDAVDASHDARELGRRRIPAGVFERLCANAAHCPHPTR